MANRVSPDDPLVRRWLAEGVSLEAHTFTHPCPLFDRGDFRTAGWTYHHRIDQLNRVPGTWPVVFRMPCLDLWNTTSPRFYSEIFNGVSPEGRFLKLSSSVTVMFTAADPALPREIVRDEDGRERFTKYANQGAEVFGRPAYLYGNFVKDYPYPIVAAGRRGEIPMITSDNTMAIYWSRYGTRTLRDWQVAVDAAVLKRGIVAFCFHTTGGIRAEELVTLVDHAVQRHGRRLKFLTFREVEDRLTAHLLAGQPLRAPDGGDNGVRLLDLNRDGYLDVVIGNPALQRTGLWDPQRGRWRELPLPVRLVETDAAGRRHDAGVRFVDVNQDGWDDVILSNAERYALHLYVPQLHLGFPPGWSRQVITGQRGEVPEIPPIVRDGPFPNNGVWFIRDSMLVQNEDTAAFPDHILRLTFDDLLRGLQPPPLSPEESLARLRVDPACVVELVAHEPLVRDPIAFDWGPDGRLWVVEMGDYPLGEDGQGRPGGVIRWLANTDGDGRYDTLTVFLEGIAFPTGVLPWRQGVLVSAAPDIFYAADTDGDVFLLRAGEYTLTAPVPGTGTWDHYREEKFGEPELPAGLMRVVIAPAQPPAQYLMDLRTLRLVPTLSAGSKESGASRSRRTAPGSGNHRAAPSS